MSKDKDLGRLMGNEKAVLKEIKQNNQVNVKDVFKHNLGQSSQFYKDIPNQSFAENDSSDPALSKKAQEIIQNHKNKISQKEAKDKKMKDAFYQALWK